MNIKIKVHFEKKILIRYLLKWYQDLNLMVFI